MSEDRLSDLTVRRPKANSYKIRGIGLGAAIGIVVVGSLVSPALAGTSSRVTRHAEVRWSFSINAISAHSRPKLTFTAIKSEVNDSVVVQKEYGGVWRDLARLSGTSGSFEGPVVLQGEYEYRIEVRTTSGAVLAVETRPLFVYANIPLTEFVGNEGGTVVVGSSLFAYMAADKYGGNFLKIVNSTCRSVNLKAAYVKGADFTPSPSATLTAVTTVADPVVLTLDSGTTGVIQTAMSKDITIQLSSIDGDGGDTAFLTGTLNCYTATGIPPNS